MRDSEQQRLKLERPIIVFVYRVLARWLGRTKFLLLTTTGHRSQQRRTVPLVYMPVEGGYLVTAANVGSDAHPGWFWNLKHHPQAQIQIGSALMDVLAEEQSAPQREWLWADWIRVNPGYQRFQEKTARRLPLVILRPAAA
jgi:deazaflavin-dependent oxidoreductase (nitroreductase family)